MAVSGRANNRDEMMAAVWKWLPWLSFALAIVPLPIIFGILYFNTTTPDAVAFFLALAVATVALGSLLAIIVLLVMLFLKRRWFRRFRNRLAEDGITADEVTWFYNELTSAERKALAQLDTNHPALADAFRETLGARLTATRLIQKTRKEQLNVERRILRARSLSGADTSELIEDLQRDHNLLEGVRNEATSRLAQAKARLQSIEAVASRRLNHLETDPMLRRLSASQSQLPIAMEIAALEQEILRELDQGKPEIPPAKLNAP